MHKLYASISRELKRFAAFVLNTFIDITYEIKLEINIIF